MDKSLNEGIELINSKCERLGFVLFGGIEFLVITDGFQNVRGRLELVLEAIVTIGWYYIKGEREEEGRITFSIHGTQGREVVQKTERWITSEITHI